MAKTRPLLENKRKHSGWENTSGHTESYKKSEKIENDIKTLHFTNGQCLTSVGKLVSPKIYC